MQPPDPNAPAVSRAVLRDVVEDEAGQRIDNYLLRHLKGVPRSHVYRVLRRGEVRVNSGRVDASYRVQVGDRVRIPPLRLGAPRPAAGKGRSSPAVLYEDERLLVLDKAAGTAVHGGSGVRVGLIDQLRAYHGDTAPYLELVHRLDRDTSGCLMVAKKRSALRTLHSLLRDGVVEKRYLALVAGDWPNAGLVDAPLDTHHRRGAERVVRVQAAGKASASRFHTLQRLRTATLVEVETLSGRTHQIRVHATHAGHPLAGDEKYGDQAFNAAARKRGLRRLFLHAHVISFSWPDTHADVHVSAPLPDDLRAVVDAFAAPGN